MKMREGTCLSQVEPIAISMEFRSHLLYMEEASAKNKNMVSNYDMVGMISKTREFLPISFAMIGWLGC